LSEITPKDRAEVSLYGDGKVTPECLALNIVRLKDSFPKLENGWYRQLQRFLEAERFNAQNKQQVEQANVQLNNQDEMMRYNEIPRYEALQLTAMEKTKNDLYNYFNAGIENEMNEFNYKNSYNITKSMFPEITTDMFGVPIVKQDTKTYFDNTYSKKEEPKKKGK
jgi:hypothetical protein